MIQIKSVLVALILIIGVSVVSGCGKTKVITNTPGTSNPPVSNEDPSETKKDSLPSDVAKNYKLVWHDEFDGDKLDMTKWSYRGDGTTRKLGIVTKDNISVDGKGNLVIKVTKVDGKYYIGQIGTQGKFETKYGYFECRAKMNQQIGPHVAFWLQSPLFGKYIGDPAKSGAEIDIFEYHRKTPTTVYHNIHWDGYGDDHKTVGSKVTIPNIFSGYHVFGLKWTPTEYTFYIDGKETWKTSTAVSETNEYIILSAELTGWGGDPDMATFPDEVLFDYVRVYQQK